VLRLWIACLCIALPSVRPYFVVAMPAPDPPLFLPSTLPADTYNGLLGLGGTCTPCDASGQYTTYAAAQQCDVKKLDLECKAGEAEGWVRPGWRARASHGERSSASLPPRVNPGCHPCPTDH